ncbi:MAG: RES domain-containing protein [Gemmatimonas sp.]|nr:RES domain-containing protein [Gemmatimonas sp.]
MRVWRLATSLHPPLTGEGAALRGGRWNSIGLSVVYASTHLSLALVELLVHLDSLDLPRNLVACAVEFPNASLEKLEPNDLPGGWRDDLRVTRAIGDEWIESERSLALAVPSVIVPQEANVLLNPAHVRFAQVQVLSQESFQLDPRLLANPTPD